MSSLHRLISIKLSPTTNLIWLKKCIHFKYFFVCNIYMRNFKEWTSTRIVSTVQILSLCIPLEGCIIVLLYRSFKSKNICILYIHWKCLFCGFNFLIFYSLKDSFRKLETQKIIYRKICFLCPYVCVPVAHPVFCQ